MSHVSGTHFNGRDANPHLVTVEIDQRIVIVSGDGDAAEFGCWLLVAWFIGDVSTIAAAAPAALLKAKYSRELEIEADLYAIQVLQENGIPTRHLGDILRRLDAESGLSNAPAVLGYLSTHPATSERLQRLDTR